MKKNTVIMLVIFILILLVFKHFSKLFKKPKFNTMQERTDWSLNDVKKSVQKVELKYGVAFAQNVEKLFRKETRHFKSGQWLKTLSPGMEISGGTNSTKTTFPFGWASLQEFTKANPQFAGNYYVSKMNENGTGFSKTFIGFPNVESSFMFVAWFIKNKRGGRFGYWYSLNETSAISYENSLKEITSQFA